MASSTKDTARNNVKMASSTEKQNQCEAHGVDWGEDRIYAAATFKNLAGGDAKDESHNCHHVRKSHAAAENPNQSMSITKVLVEGLSSNISDDYLLNFLEHFNFMVEKIVRGNRNDAAIVHFEEVVDIEKLADICGTQSLEGHRLNVKPVIKGGAVLLRNPNPTTEYESFLYHFKNKKNGGSKEAKIFRDKGNRFLIAFFESIDVARRVVQTPSTLEGVKLELELFDPDLGFPPDSEGESPAGAEVILPTLPPRDTTEDADRPPGTDLPHGTRPLEDIDQGLSRSMSGMSVNDRHETRKRIKKEMAGLHHAYLFLLDAFSDLIEVQFGPQVTIRDNTVEIEGFENEVFKVCELLKALSWNQKSSSYIAEVARFFTDWEAVFCDLDIEINNSNYYLISREGLVDDLDIEELTIGVENSERHDGTSLMTFDQFLAWKVDKKKVQTNVEKARYLLDSLAWDEFLENDMETKFCRKIQVKERENYVFVFGDKRFLNDAADDIKEFLENKSIKTQIKLKHSKVKELIEAYKMDSLRCGTGPESVEVIPEQHSCLIRLSGYEVGVRKAERLLKNIEKDFSSMRAIFYHPGLSRFIHSHSQQWESIVSDACFATQCLYSDDPDGQIQDRDDQESPGWGHWNGTVLHSFKFKRPPLNCHVVEGEVEDMKVDAIVVCRDDQHSAAARDQHAQSPLSSAPYVKRSSSDPSGRPFPIPPPSPGTGARPKSNVPEMNKTDERKPTRGGIEVTQPGCYPCKAVIEVSLPRYFSEPAKLADEVRELIRDILQACDDNHFTSLALPLFGVDVVMPSNRRKVAIDVASKALVNSIVDAFSYIARHVQRSTTERNILLCSKQTACLKGLTYFLVEQSTAYEQWSQTSISGFNFLSCQLPVGNTRKVLQSNAIKVTVGEIGKSKADVLVVPLDLETELDLNKSKLTKSLLFHGGRSVQASVLYETWNPKEEFENKNAVFGDHRILTGSAGSLSANEIYYVYLPPWGPGVKKIFCNCVNNCLWKATKNRHKTVAMTALGTGEHLNYPIEFVSRTLMLTVADFLEQETTSVESVHFVIYNSDYSAIKAFNQELTDWKVFGRSDFQDSWVHVASPPLTNPQHSSNDHGATPSYANVAGKNVKGKARGAGGHQKDKGGSHSLSPLVYPYPSGTAHTRSDAYTVRVGTQNILLSVKPGNLLREKCDIIVNITNDELDFTKGGISRALFNQSCGRINEVCQKKAKKTIKKNGIVITEAPGLNFKKIVHLDYGRFMNKPKDLIKECLFKAIEQKCTAIAFPAIGTGESARGEGVKNPTRHLLDNMVQAIKDVKKPKELKEVRIIVPEKMCSKMIEELKQIASQEGRATTEPQTATAAVAPEHKAQGHSAQPWEKMATTATKHLPDCTHKEDIVSLYIYSDKLENQQRARDMIQRQIQNCLVQLYGENDTSVCNCSEALTRKSRGGEEVGGKLGYIQKGKEYVWTLVQNRFK